MSRMDDARIRGIFSARNVLVGGALFLACLLAALPGSAVEAALAAFLIVAALWLKLISRNQLGPVRIERIHQPRVFEGERTPVLLRLHRGGGLPVQMLELRDQFLASLEHDERQLVPLLSEGYEVLLHYRHHADRHRGLYTLGPVQLRAGDPLGVFFEERELPCLTDLTVYPKADPLPFYRIPGPQPQGGPSMDYAPQVGDGEEVLGVREYHPGDPPGRVHWRTSARRGGLHVVQLNRQLQGEVAVMIDLTRRSRMGLGGESTTELGIRAAISILSRAFEARHRFSLTYAHEELTRLPAESGLSHLHMLLDRLAILAPGGETEFWRPFAARALALAPGSRAVFIVTAMETPPGPVGELVRRLVLRGVAVDIVLIDEREFIRIYRDQEFDIRKKLPDFARVMSELRLAGARVFPLTRTEPRLAEI